VQNHLIGSILAVAALAFSPINSSATAQRSESVNTRAVLATPDLSGVWIVRDFRVSIVPKEDPPFQPWARAAYKMRLRDLAKSSHAYEGPDTPIETCRIPPGVPRTMLWPLPWEIVQTRDRVIIIYEYQSLVRHIYTDGRKHPKNPDLTYMGHSIGRYEGDTLVVDTVGFSDKGWLDLFGHLPHTDALHILERIHRIDHDTLVDEFTVDDTKAYTKPWTAQKSFKFKPDWEIQEYVCMEK
jgi:hypothetical protein